MRISDWSSDVCSSDLFAPIPAEIEIALPVIWQFDDKAAECLLVAHHRLAGRIEFAGELHHDRLDERIERRCSRERDRGRKRTYQRTDLIARIGTDRKSTRLNSSH